MRCALADGQAPGRTRHCAKKLATESDQYDLLVVENAVEYDEKVLCRALASPGDRGR